MGVSYCHYIIPRDNSVRPEPDRIVALIDAWVEKGFAVLPQGDKQEDLGGSNHQLLGTGARFRTSPLFGEALERQQALKPQRGFWAKLLGKPQKDPRPDPWLPFHVSPVGASFMALTQPYTLIEWKENPRAVYPLQTVTDAMSRGDQRFLHRLMIELSDDFMNPHTDLYEGSARQVNPNCSCGNNLEYEDENAPGWLATARIRRVCPACGLAFRPQDRVAEIVNGTTGAKHEQPGGLCNRFAIIIEFGKELPLYRRDQKDDDLADPKATRLFLDTCRDALEIDLNEFSYYA